MGRKIYKVTLNLLCGLLVLIPQSSFGTFTALPFIKNRTIDLEVPIELTDSGLASTSNFNSVTPTVFETTRTSLDTTDYDGTVSYIFECVLDNSDSFARTVSLVDATNSVKASLSVPAGTANPTLYRVTFIPTSGASNYRIKIDSTTAQDDVWVHSARILVKQVGATKTKLYYPLASDEANQYYIASSGHAVDDALGTTWSSRDLYSIRWLKSNMNLATIASGNAWTLEAVISSSNSAAIAQVALAKAGTATLVSASQAGTSSTAPTLVSASFPNNATNFTDNSEFQAKVASASSGYSSYLYKAGIWVKLTNLSKGYVMYRVGRAQLSTAASAGSFYGQRIIGSRSNFSHPSYQLETIMWCGSSSNCANMALYDDGANDSTVSSTPTKISNSAVLAGSSPARSVSVGLSITSGTRYFAGFTGLGSSGTSLYMTNTFLVVAFQK